MANFDALPPGVIPTAVGRVAGAALLSISQNHFMRWVESGVLPRGRVMGSRVLWDTQEIRDAFLAIPRCGEVPAPAAAIVAATDDGWDDVE